MRSRTTWACVSTAKCRNRGDTGWRRGQTSSWNDAGDALLHALNEILCGASKYRELTPSDMSLHCNRTIALALKPDYTYWTVLHCTWNTFELEDFGMYMTDIGARYFNSSLAVEDIKRNLTSKLQTALIDTSGGSAYRPVDFIKLVVKQLKGFADLKSEEAGTLTKSTVTALREIIDEAAGSTSQLCE